MTVVPENRPNPALYRARWVLPMDQDPIEDGAVIVRGLSIDAVGPFAEMKQLLPRQAWVDLGEVVIFPGLINCHTHLDNSVLAKEKLTGNSMADWVRNHQRAMADISIEEVRKSYLDSLSSLTSMGTLAVADITYLSREKLPLGEEPLWSLNFFEVRGFDSERATANLEKARNDLELAWKTVSGVWDRFGISAHGPHSLDGEILTRIAERCRTRGDVFTLHCAESPAEVEFLQSGTGPFAGLLKEWNILPEQWQAPGKTPVEYLQSLGVLDKNTMAVHCVHLTDNDLQLFKEAGATACLCPRSNETIGTGTAKANEMQRLSIPLVLGTDGLGSTPSLSMFDEMAACARLHSGLAPMEILKMTTINAASTLRVDSILGSFGVNKLGRFLVYSGEVDSDPAEPLVNGVDHNLIEWCGGDIDMRP